MRDVQWHGPWDDWQVAEEIRPAAHTAEWVTLATAHAVALADSEATIREKWRPIMAWGDSWNHVNVGGRDVYGSPDEWIFYTELSQRSFPLVMEGLTAAWICCPNVEHPNLAYDRNSARDLCKRAQSEGYSFVRKVSAGDDVSEVIAGVRECHRESLTPLPDCNNWACSSVGDDCCAPHSISEAATCTDDFTPVRLVEPCGGFGEGNYHCCK